MPADYGLERPDTSGTYRTGESINRNWQWYTVRAAVDFAPTGDRSDAAQRRFELLLQIFETKAQPAVIGPVFTTTETNPPDLPVLNGAGPSTVWNMRLGVEHADVWDSTDDFLMALDGLEGFVYDIAVTTNNNVSLAVADGLQ